MFRVFMMKQTTTRSAGTKEPALWGIFAAGANTFKYDKSCDYWMISFR